MHCNRILKFEKKKKKNKLYIFSDYFIFDIFISWSRTNPEFIFWGINRIRVM